VSASLQSITRRKTCQHCLQIASVLRYEPKRGVGPKAEGVKSTHILPFVPNFAAMVVRLEALQERAQVAKPEALLSEGKSPPFPPIPHKFPPPLSTGIYL